MARLDEPDRLLAVRRLGDAVPLVLEDEPQGVADRRLVVGDEDRGAPRPRAALHFLFGARKKSVNSSPERSRTRSLTTLPGGTAAAALR